MSLDWNLSSIENYDTVCFIETGEKDSDGKALRRLNPVTEALIWSTISVGIGSITEDNAPEFFARLRIVEAVQGDMLVGPKGPEKLKPEDVRAHVGLQCNVSFETRQEWAERMIIGFGDGLSRYGDKALTDEQIEAQRERAIEQAHDRGDYDEAARLEDQQWRRDVSMTHDLVRHYRREAARVEPQEAAA